MLLKDLLQYLHESDNTVDLREATSGYAADSQQIAPNQGNHSLVLKASACTPRLFRRFETNDMGDDLSLLGLVRLSSWGMPPLLGTCVVVICTHLLSLVPVYR
jgi:hypothetical protein